MTCQAECEHLIGLPYRRIARKVGHCEPGSLGGGSTDLLVTSLVPNAEIFSGQRRKNENKLSSVQNPAEKMLRKSALVQWLGDQVSCSLTLVITELLDRV